MQRSLHIQLASLAVLLLLTKGDCFNVTVTITPQPLVLRANQSDTGGMVSVVCVTSGLHTGDRVVLMSIRRTADDVTSHLVSASQNEKAASLESTSGLTGATATGGITIPPNASTVNLTLTQARCYQDEGNYTCSVSVLKRQANTLSRMSDQENLTITVSVEQAVLTVEPKDVSSWGEGDYLELTCAADVGRMDPDTQVVWVWEFRDTGTPWQDHGDNSTDIKDGPIVQKTCHQRRSSILTWQLTVNDTDRDYRCYVKRRQGQGNYTDYTQYAASYSLGTVYPVSPGPAVLTVTPQGVTRWVVGDTLAMRCHAYMGKVDSDTDIQWVWEWRNTRGVPTTNWQTYDGHQFDIQDGPRTRHTRFQNCSSTLTQQLTLTDTDREYRCYIRRRQGQGQYVAYKQFAAKHSVGTVTHVTPGPTTLTATPKDITQWVVGDNLTLTCEASVGTVNADTQIQWVWEWRNTSNASTTNWHDYDGRPSDIQDGPRTQHTRYQNRSSTLTRQLTLADTDREYRCYVRRRQGQGQYVAYSQFAAEHTVGNVTHATPGPTTLTARPAGITLWVVGDTLALTCQASVGTVDANTQIQWVWEWRNTSNASTTNWHDYDGSPSDIQDGPRTQHTHYQHRSSTLTRQLTLPDTDREYRCYVRRGQGQGQYVAYSQFAAEHTVGNVTHGFTSPVPVTDSSWPSTRSTPVSSSWSTAVPSSSSAETVTVTTATVIVSTQAVFDSTAPRTGEASGDKISTSDIGIIVAVVILVMLVIVGACTANMYFLWCPTCAPCVKKRTQAQASDMSGLPGDMSGVPSAMSGVPSAISGVPGAISGVPSDAQVRLERYRLPTDQESDNAPEGSEGSEGSEMSESTAGTEDTQSTESSL